ncbi:MAG TPA: hypothetical protein VFL80_12780, partial [Thermoanaerobaculia bacterium]|nr:hypothetical protein [Thermoanaerobaculia bacterium]
MARRRREKSNAPPAADHSHPPSPSSSGSHAVPVAILVLLNLLVFGQILGHSFIHYDDGQFIYENETVKRGLTSDSLRWALTSTELGYYPLTWLSHMLDVQLWGLRAGGHLATSLLLHILSALLLFFSLVRMTALRWPSALVAALFAIHPMHVESVAWASERKDTLSTLFGMAALFFYACYARPADGEMRGVRRNWMLWWTVGAMALSLGAKQMLVTLPFVLLLLDYWPLQRLGRRAVVEKVPLFALTLIGSWLAVAGQKNLKAIQSTEMLPLADRIRNALVAYVSYVGKMFWPDDLAVLYPLQRIASPAAAAAALLLLGITAGAWYARRRAPYLLTGWLWFLGTLVPVIGVVQIGSQSMADRYSYFPYIGLFIAAVWGGRDLLARTEAAQSVRIAIAVLVIAALSIRAFVQTSHWRNTSTLFEHVLAVTGENPLAEYTLGQSLQLTEPDRALAHLRRAAAIMERTKQERPDVPMPPEYAQSYVGIGTALLMKARASHEPSQQIALVEEAAEAYRMALRIDPAADNARRNLALAEAMRPRTDPALA